MIPSTQTLVSTSQPTESTYMIPSPQTIVSTTQPSESTYHTTAPSPDTPSCQNMYISPSQRSQSSSYAFFTPIIDPPILSSPPGRFKRFSTPQNTLTTPPFPPQNSSLQNMESPTSSLKLNLSVPQQTTTCLGAPPLSPLSPLKLCLSSNFPNSSNVRSNSSTTPTTDHTDNVIPQYFSLKSEPRTIQIGQPETGQVSESNLKIMDELREAEAKVKYLKKMLKQKRIPQKTNLQKPSTRKLDFLDENLEAIRAPSPSEMTQNYIDSEKVTKQDEANMDNQHSLQRAYGILEVKNLEEQRHSISNIDTANSNSWDNKLCAGKCFNGWSSTSDGLFIETLQDSFLKGYGFDQRSGSGIKQPVSDGFGIVYSQSTATTVNIRPGDESGCFDDNFGQKDTHFMDSNIVTTTSCEANLLWNPYPGIDLQESSYLVDQTMMERESEINLIESSLLRHQSPASINFVTTS